MQSYLEDERYRFFLDLDGDTELDRDFDLLFVVLFSDFLPEEVVGGAFNEDDELFVDGKALEMKPPQAL
jgi:hypothetical protein